MDDDQQFCLRWNNHQSTLISVFDTLLENGTLVDCTLAAEGKFLKAHKVVLSACSPYFAALLSQQYDKHPIFILKDVKFQELRAMMDYMYRGEVNISQDQLAALLKAAESLQIKGLSDNRGSSSSSAAPPSQQKQQQSETAAAKTLPPPVPVNKASGLTIENKRPLKSELHDSDLSGSREGSTSPTSRKRKKVRRGSVDTNNLTDNHDQHSNSSSHSMHSSLQPQALALTSGSSAIVASVPAINNAATSLSSSSSTAAAVVAATSAASAVTSANVLAATASAVAAAASAAIKKTESVQQQQVAEALKLQLVKQHLPTSTQQQQQQQLQKAQDTEEDEELSETEHGDGHGDDDSDNELDEPQSKRRQAQGGDGEDGKSINQSELMIEPKNEYDDGQDENVEDLTLDEEELLDDLDQAGPSHGEGSSQGYAQWQMEREQNEAFMAAQDAVGGPHRDAQDHLLTSANAARCRDGRRLLQFNDLLFDIKFSDLSKFLNPDGRYQCPRRECDKNYKDASSLQRHIRYECGGMKKFRCVMCGKAFSQGSHLKRHLESGVYARPARPQAATSTAAAAAKKLKTITVTTPQLTTTSATVLESASQVAQITANTPVILNDLNDCLLESKNIVVSKKDNKYILFTTAAPEPISLQPATTSQIQSITLQPLQVSAATVTAPAAATLHTATVIDTGRIEELLKRDKIIKKTELQSDGTTTTTYIFDECDILPLKTTSKNVINTAPTVQQATSVKPTTLSIVKVAPDNVITTGGGATATVVPAVPQPALPATLISASPNPSQIISTKKLLKPTHPRIKYSKHKNPSVQSVAALPILTIPTVPSSNIGQSLSLSVPEAPVGTTTTKIELLNFSLSRKFPGQNTKTIDVSNIQQIPITAVSKPVPTTRYTVSDYETITSNTSQSNDFTSGMIDDLDYSVIDDIELPDDVQVNFAESYSSSKGAHGATTEDDEDDGDDSQDAPKPLPGKKSTGKTEAKILNASMDDKYALLANTSIMKNFEYTVNESVVSDGDDGEMRQYICRHCGKRYRWKSTLRRHENVECGGKEAMHQCPYCTYKAKQRGNLGVHIRKHHSEMPQLESRRKSKTRDSLNLIESIKAEAEGQL